MLGDIGIQAPIRTVLQEKVDIINSFLTALKLDNIVMREFLPRIDLILNPMHQVLQIINNTTYLFFIHQFTGQHRGGIILEAAEIGCCKGATAKLLGHIDDVFGGYGFFLPARLFLHC